MKKELTIIKKAQAFLDSSLGKRVSAGDAIMINDNVYIFVGDCRLVISHYKEGKFFDVFVSKEYQEHSEEARALGEKVRAFIESERPNHVKEFLNLKTEEGVSALDLAKGGKKK